MNKLYALLIGLLMVFSTQVQAQVASSFDIHIMKWRFNATTEAYMDANGYSTDARILGHSAIYGSGDPSKANLESVRAWLVKSFPDVNSSNYVILNWETGPYVAMRTYPVTDSRFKAAESEIIKLIDEVKRVRPNLKVSMYQMPFRFWSSGQNTSYNATGKFDRLFAKLDFIAPSYYILYADEEVGHERNLQYIRENLNVALAYGKKFNKPVIPFMWHKIHPYVSEKYKSEIIQKEVFAKYIKYIYTYSYNNYKAAGVWWYDGLSDQLKDVSGINNHLQGSVYDKLTYNIMIVNHARYVKQVLNGATITSPAPAPTPAGQKVVSYTLIDATTEKPIQTLTSGMTLNLATLPTKKLNIRANTNPEKVGSVVFSLSGAQSKRMTETAAPYALFGDNSGNYNAWTPYLGSYTLKATPYTAAGGSGTAGAALTINFTVINKITATSTARATAITYGSQSMESAEEEAVATPGSISVYPNPVATKLNIEVAGAGAGLCTIRVYDWAGKAVQIKTVDNAALDLATELNVEELQKGLYILRIDTPEGSHTSQRIIVE